jgi:acetylornithine/N-succinyldiaminopimelate aminotransferase
MKTIYKAEKQYIMQTYKRPPMILELGVNASIYDIKHKKYIDFVGGIATCSVGHGNPYVKRAVADQAGRLINATNLYYTEPQVQLAKRLSHFAGFATKAFLCNSGAEAVEAALKLARKHTGRHEIIGARHGFHGRTYGALAATWRPRYKKPFAPGLAGFKHVRYNSPRALEKAISSKSAAFIVEPIQGEEGVITPDPGYLKAVSRICKDRGVLLIVDEIQTGVGRTGAFFAFQHERIRPDIITMAKGLANGIPIGVTLARPAVARAFVPGDHGSTFGGNSLSCRAALAVLDYIKDNGLIKRVQDIGEYFRAQLASLKEQHVQLGEIRGKGLMVGIKTRLDGHKVVEACRRKGLLINCCPDNVLRCLPPLIVKRNEIDFCIRTLDQVIKAMS